jgi:hypothetical protein
MYAGVSASVGIEVDLWVVSGRYEIISAGIGAVLEAGIANPLWCRGAIGGYYSILDGLVEGNCSFEFSIGQACLPGTGDPLSNIKLISDISPRPDDSGKNGQIQDLIMNLGAATNLKMSNKEIKIEERKAGEKVGTMRIFRFREDLIKATMTQNGKPIALKKEVDKVGFGIGYTPVNGGTPITLDKDANCYFSVKANLEECGNVLKSESPNGTFYYCGGNWALAKKDGVVFEESKSVSFKTGAGFEKIKDENISKLFPYHLQRYFCYQDDGMGLSLKKYSFNENSYQILPKGLNPNDYTIKYIVRAIPFSIGSPVLKKNLASLNGLLNIPIDFSQKFAPSTFYRMQLVARWESKNNTQTGQQGADFTKVKAADFSKSSASNKTAGWGSSDNTKNWSNTLNHVYARLNNRELVVAKLTPATDEKILYEWDFRTSKHANLTSKMASLTLTEAEYSEKPGIGSKKPVKTATLNKAELATSTTIENALRQKLGLKSTEKIKTYIARTDFMGTEKFDDFDLNGLVSVADEDVKTFYNDLEEKIYGVLVKNKKAENPVFLKMNSEILGTMSEWLSTSTDGDTDPPLSVEEITAAQNSSGQTVSKPDASNDNSRKPKRGYNFSTGKMPTLRISNEYFSNQSNGGGLQTEPNRIFGRILTETIWLGYPADYNVSHEGNIYSSMGVAYDMTNDAFYDFSQNMPNLSAGANGGFNNGAKTNAKVGY